VDGYYCYCICFHIFDRIRIQTWIDSDMYTNADCFGRIDVYRIRSEPDAVNIIYRYFLGYRVKATFSHIIHVVTFEHPMLVFYPPRPSRDTPEVLNL
jgi:hypothetical protein